MPDVWLITGIPGAGKTTIARPLASRFERSVHLGVDDLQEWIVSGADNGNLTPEETVSYVLKNRGRARIGPSP